MLPPFAGSLLGTIRRSTQVSIHGDIYYDVLLEPDNAVADPGKIAVLPIRVPTHALPQRAAPETGRRAEVSFLMQQVTALKYV